RSYDSRPVLSSSHSFFFYCHCGYRHLPSFPTRRSSDLRPFSLKRATPTTRLLGAARLASRASVGPIFPPTPRIMRSPSTLPNSRSEEHTSELQSRENLVCRLLLEKKKEQ